ncbi:hypothetical protein N7507_007434 [Penicillium longicatenatum]|nr:hypothetical protein N7507_007434 [Penicillium longicatenatum]
MRGWELLREEVWEARFQQIVLQNQHANIPDLIESFRTTYSEIKKIQNLTSKQVNETPFQDRKNCPCGGPHPAIKCWYLNERLHLDDWKKAPHREEKIKKAFEKEPSWKDWIEEEIEDQQTEETTYANYAVAF